MDKKLTEKIKELLTSEDLQLFESGLDKYTKSEVQKAVELMKEEVKKDYDELSKKFCDKVIAEAKADFEKKLIEEKVTIVEKFDGQLNQLEQKVVGRLNTFIEHVVKDKISDERIEVIAENAIMLPIVEKMKKVFAESYVSIDTDGSTKIKELSNTIKKIETQLTEAIASKIESEEKLDKTATYLFISEKTQGLTESDKSRVVKMFKDKKLDSNHKWKRYSYLH